MTFELGKHLMAATVSVVIGILVANEFVVREPYRATHTAQQLVYILPDCGLKDYRAAEKGETHNCLYGMMIPKPVLEHVAIPDSGQYDPAPIQAP